MKLPKTHKIKVYQVYLYLDEVDQDGNIIDELPSETMDFDTIEQAEKFVDDNPVGSEYGYYDDGIRCIVSKIDFDYEQAEIEVFWTKEERAAAQPFEDMTADDMHGIVSNTEKLIDGLTRYYNIGSKYDTYEIKGALHVIHDIIEHLER